MSRVQALLVVLACLVGAAWAARRVGPPLSADTPRRQVAEAAPVPAHGILAEAQRLRSHLASPPPFRAPSRNPFRFHEPPPPTTVRGKSRPALTTAAAEHEAVERPEMKLLGIAEDPAADGTVRRTAIVSGMSQLFFAKEGERVLGSYEVVRITSDTVQVRSPHGETFTLALR